MIGPWMDELRGRINITRYLCIPPGKYDTSLIGKYGDVNPYSFINLSVNMCNNKTSNNTCPTQAVLEPMLKSAFINLIYLDYEIDHKNFSNPLKPYMKSDSLSVNWDLNVRYFYYLKNFFYNTDVGFVFEENQPKNAYYFSKNEPSVQIKHGSALYPDVTIATMTFCRNYKSDFFYRSYPKFQTLIAKIGGVIQGLLIIGKTVALIITKNLFLVDIFNLYIEFDEENDNLNKSSDSLKNVLKNNNNKNTMNINLSNNYMNPVTASVQNFVMNKDITK
jgi:hypothetical protein